MSYGPILQPAHGEIYYDDPTGYTLTLTEAGTYYTIKNAGATADNLKMMTANVADGTLTIGTGGAGIYNCYYSLDYSCTTNDTTFKGAIFKDGVRCPCVASERKVKQASTITPSNKSGPIPLAVGNVIEFKICCDNAGEVVTIKNFNLHIIREDV